MQATRGVALGDERSHARLDDGTATRLHGFHLGWAEVDADYVMSLVGEAGCGDRAHVAKPEYAYRWTHADNHR